jgi:hypothetical protein
MFLAMYVGSVLPHLSPFTFHFFLRLLCNGAGCHIRVHRRRYKFKDLWVGIRLSLLLIEPI